MCAMSFRTWELIQEYLSKDQIKRQRELATGKRAPPQRFQLSFRWELNYLNRSEILRQFEQEHKNVTARP
jgi:hypothetical protein